MARAIHHDQDGRPLLPQALDAQHKSQGQGFVGAAGFPPNHPGKATLKKGLEVKDSYVGNDAQNQREFMDLVYPIERGMIMDWDSMLKVWEFVFHELQTDVDGTTPVMCWLCFHQ